MYEPQPIACRMGSASIELRGAAGQATHPFQAFPLATDGPDCLIVIGDRDDDLEGRMRRWCRELLEQAIQWLGIVANGNDDRDQRRHVSRTIL